MKKLFIAISMLLLSLHGISQVTNNAISFERNGRLSLGALQDININSGITIQLWINPKAWIPGANIMKWGESFTIQLGTPGKLLAKTGGDNLVFTDSSLQSGNWSH
jgi:hypothetical protein